MFFHVVVMYFVHDDPVKDWDLSIHTVIMVIH